MDYIDGFVAAVPTANRDRYKEHSQSAAKVFKDYGALRVAYVAPTYVVFDWAYQSAIDNPELSRVSGGGFRAAP